MILFTAIFLLSLLNVVLWGRRLRKSIANGRYSFAAPQWRRKSAADALVWVIFTPFFFVASLILTALFGFAAAYTLLGK